VDIAQVTLDRNAKGARYGELLNPGKILSATADPRAFIGGPGAMLTPPADEAIGGGE